MVETKVKILVKVALDALFVIIVFGSFFAALFSYNDKVNIYLTSATETESDTSKSFSDYKDDLCSSSAQNVTSEEEDLCDLLSSWQTAGRIYIVVAIMSIVFCAYGIIRFVLRLAEKDFSFRVKYDLEYYIYPILSLLALILYIAVSEVFSKDLPAGYAGTSSTSATVEAGLILMILAFLVSLGSKIYFIVLRKDLEQKSKLGKPLLSK